MRATGLGTESDIAFVVDAIGRQNYGGNLEIKSSRQVSRNVVTFTIRATSSRGPGARCSWSGRRSIAACWHAHRDVMRALFTINPDGKLYTAMATYIGRQGFEDNFEATAGRNIGSRVSPAYMPDLCECEDNVPIVYRATASVYRPSTSADSQHWTPADADREIEDWNAFVAEIKANKPNRVER